MATTSSRSMRWGALSTLLLALGILFLSTGCSSGTDRGELVGHWTADNPHLLSAGSVSVVAMSLDLAQGDTAHLGLTMDIGADSTAYTVELDLAGTWTLTGGETMTFTPDQSGSRVNVTNIPEHFSPAQEELKILEAFSGEDQIFERVRLEGDQLSLYDPTLQITLLLRRKP